MKILDLTRTDLRTIDTTETMLDAATAFAGETVGLLLVVERNRLAGVLSERDVVRMIGEGQDAESTHVFDAMTEDVLTVTPDTDVRDAARAMLADEVRHLVVVDGDAPVGVVSARDLLAATVGEGAPS